MKTYKLIIQKILNTENNIFSSNYDKTDKVDESCKLFFYIFLNEDITIQNKFNFFFNSLNSIFLKDKKNEFINYFCKIQKTYKALNKFIYIYKFKKAKIVANTDMALNLINDNQKNIISILHNNSKYLFNINDLINIINTSLTNNYLFFSEPLCIKNPYNNLPFLKSTLYNIYLFVKFNTYYCPTLLIYFFYCNFNLTIFKVKYEYIIRQISIENYVDKSPSNILINEINKMINEFNNTCRISRLKNKIIIDKDFPTDKLIKIMRPYLLIYMYSLYSLLPYKKSEMKNILRISLLKFNNHNPLFGRKRIKILINYNNNFKKKIVGKIVEFDDNHIKLFDVNKMNTNFLQDHLSYTEHIFNNNFVFFDDDDDDDDDNDDDNDDDDDDDDDDDNGHDNDEIDSVS